MTNKFLTSLGTSKQLKGWGCDVGSNKYWQWHCVSGKCYLRTKKQAENSIYPFEHYLKAYDLPHDVCCDKAKEFFGKKEVIEERNKKNKQPALFFNGPSFIFNSFVILEFLHENRKKEAEKYFLEKTIFNPKNR